MAIRTLKGRQKLIGPTFEVEVPIDSIDPKDYPGAIVYTKDAVHFFSDGQNWVSFNDLVSEIRRPVVINPEEDSTTKNVRPEIVGTPRSSLFGDNASLYRRFQIKLASDFDWSNPIVDNEIQQDSYQILVDLDFLTDYQVRIKDRDDIGTESSWSTVVDFQTTDNVVTPINLSPSDGEIDVIQQPDLVGDSFKTAVFDETHVGSEFYLESIDGSVTHSSGEITGTRVYSVPSGIIDQNGTEYQWQCRYKGDQTGWSQWSEFTNFFSENPRVLQPVNQIPFDGDTDTAADNIILQSSVFDTSVVDDVHINSEWEIYFASDSTLAHTSTIISTELEAYRVPSDAIEGNIQYFWRVRHEGQQLGWSKWSETTLFTPYEPFIATPTGQSPSGDELVGQEDQVLQSDTFEVKFGTDTHIASEWRVINQSTQLVVYGPVRSTSPLTQHTVPKENFEANTFYEWQVRHEGEQFGYSDWSSPASFQVASRFISQPTNQTPPNGEQKVNVETLTLTADAFEVQFGTDTHKDSQWQIRNNDTGQIVFDNQYNNPPGLESIDIPSNVLEGGGQAYRWRVRYRGDATEASDWSFETSFNGIKLAIEKPTNISPTDNETDVFPNPTLTSSNYSSNLDVDSHTETQIEIKEVATGIVVYNPTLGAVTSYDVPTGTLELNTEYQWRVRYNGSDLDWSEWSDTTTFTTIASDKEIIFTSDNGNYNLASYSLLSETITNSYVNQAKPLSFYLRTESNFAYIGVEESGGDSALFSGIDRININDFTLDASINFASHEPTWTPDNTFASDLTLTTNYLVVAVNYTRVVNGNRDFNFKVLAFNKSDLSFNAIINEKEINNIPDADNYVKTQYGATFFDSNFIYACHTYDVDYTNDNNADRMIEYQKYNISDFTFDSSISFTDYGDRFIMRVDDDNLDNTFQSGFFLCYVNSFNNKEGGYQNLALTRISDLEHVQRQNNNIEYFDYIYKEIDVDGNLVHYSLINSRVRIYKVSESLDFSFLASTEGTATGGLALVPTIGLVVDSSSDNLIRIFDPEDLSQIRTISGTVNARQIDYLEV